MWNLDNTWSRYNDQGDRIGFTKPGDRAKGDILSDISTSFLILIGIIFPSLTGNCPFNWSFYRRSTRLNELVRTTLCLRKCRKCRNMFFSDTQCTYCLLILVSENKLCVFNFYLLTWFRFADFHCNHWNQTEKAEIQCCFIVVLSRNFIDALIMLALSLLYKTGHSELCVRMFGWVKPRAPGSELSPMFIRVMR